MKVYHIIQKQFLPLSLDEAWSFFSTPKNLAKITPDTLDFKILHVSGNSSSAYPGQIITYRIKLFSFVTFRWLTEITHVHPPHYFVDDQRSGPYAIWHHQHRFKAIDGGVEMTDEITYGLPFGLLGRIVNFIFVRQQLKAIFKFRYEVIEKMFPVKITRTQMI